MTTMKIKDKKIKCRACWDTGVCMPNNFLGCSIKDLENWKNDEYQLSCNCETGKRIIGNVFQIYEPPYYQQKGDILAEDAINEMEKLINKRIQELKQGPNSP